MCVSFIQGWRLCCASPLLWLRSEWWWLHRSSLTVLLSSRLFDLRHYRFIRSIRGQTNIMLYAGIIHWCSRHLCRLHLLDVRHVFHFSRCRNTGARRYWSSARFSCHSLLPVRSVYSDVTSLWVLLAGFPVAQWFVSVRHFSSETSRSIGSQPSFTRWITDVPPSADPKRRHSTGSVLPCTSTNIPS